MSFVMEKVNSDTYVAGYKLDEALTGNPVMTFNAGKDEVSGGGDALQNGGGSVVSSVASIFKGLAVPAGLFYMQQNLNVGAKNSSNSREIKLSEKEVVHSDLYERLLDMARPETKKTFVRKTRKQRKRVRKGTRKQRK